MWNYESTRASKLLKLFWMLPICVLFFAGWAVTAHRAQGASMEGGAVAILRGLFSPGQAKVGSQTLCMLDMDELRNTLRVHPVSPVIPKMVELFAWRLDCKVPMCDIVGPTWLHYLLYCNCNWQEINPQASPRISWIGVCDVVSLSSCHWSLDRGWGSALFWVSDFQLTQALVTFGSSHMSNPSEWLA